MNKKLLYIVSLTLFAVILLWLRDNESITEVIKTDSLEIIEQELENADTTTLVIFDCDDVLIHQTDIVFAPENQKRVEECISLLINQSPTIAKKMKKLKGIIFESVDQVLVDKRMPEVIKNLQEKGIKVLMITSMKNEKLNEKFAIEIRKNELNKFGFDFSISWPSLGEKWFGSRENSQYYEKGIMCSKPGSKSEALEKFLNHSGYNPQKIIFIDDQHKNLKDIEKMTKKKGKTFKGFEYTAAKKIPYAFSFSAERLIFQMKYLEKNEIWLSDEEAERKLREN